MNALQRFCAVLLGMATLAILAACGGSGSSPSTSKATTATGKFIDGPVAGVQYIAGSKRGTTGTGGEYSYDVGSNVKFFIGDVVLGEATAGPVVTPLELVPGSQTSTPAVLNIVRFLMSVGSVDAAGNITIPPSVATAATTGKTTTLATLTETELSDLIKAVMGNPAAAVVDQAAAETHLITCLTGNTTPTVEGNFRGTMNPYDWKTQITINTDGTLTGKIVANDEAVTGKVEGTKFTAVSAGGCTFDGTVNVEAGTIAGNWVPPAGSSNIGGTFSMEKG